MEPAMIRAARAAAVTLYDDAMAKGGARWFVDKTPRHLLIIDFLVAVFPRARHLVVIRNPLDIAASRWSSWGQNIAHVLAHDLDDPAVFDTVLAYPILARHLARHLARSDIQVMPVHYENLARDPVGKLREVFTFIGAPADDATVNGCLDLSATIHARGGFGDHKIKETRAPHRESIGRWRTTLQPAWKRTILDAVGVEMMTFLGYGDAVEALRAEGIEGGDPATVDAYRHRAMAMLRRRWDDVRVSTTFEPGT